MRREAIELSVLDPSWIDHDADPGRALRATRSLAQACDDLGYRRFWVVEHHNSPAMAGTSPSTLIAAIAQATQRIRVGSGGVMLPNHPPLVVAEQFGLLDHLFPDRIDLGLGRAPGADPETCRALRRPEVAGPDFFSNQLDELLAYLSDGGSPVTATSAVGSSISPWLLGSGPGGAIEAGRRGLPFAFAFHIKPEAIKPAVAAYRKNFRPSLHLDRPYVMISVLALVLDSVRAAQEAARPAFVAMFQDRAGLRGIYPTVAEAAAYRLSTDEKAELDELYATEFIGDLNLVSRRVSDVLDEYQPDELMITAPVRDLSTRLECFSRLHEMRIR